MKQLFFMKLLTSHAAALILPLGLIFTLRRLNVLSERVARWVSIIYIVLYALFVMFEHKLPYNYVEEPHKIYDNSVYVGFYSGCLYKGLMQDTLGTFTFTEIGNDLYKYVGAFKADRAWGKGELFYKEEDRKGRLFYRGTVIDFKRHGCGILFFKNAPDLKGCWLNDQFSSQNNCEECLKFIHPKNSPSPETQEGAHH